MKNFILSAALLVATSASVSAKSNAPKVMANGYPYTLVPFTSVKMAHNSFWGARLQAAREVTVPLAFSKCESEHRYKNFDMAAYTLKHPGHAGLQTPEWDVAKFMGFSFDDTDVYKTIEGASYILQTYPDKKLKAYIDSVLNVVGAAQEPEAISTPLAPSIPSILTHGRARSVGRKRKTSATSFTISVTWWTLPAHIIRLRAVTSSSTSPAVMPTAYAVRLVQVQVRQLLCRAIR